MNVSIAEGNCRKDSHFMQGEPVTLSTFRNSEDEQRVRKRTKRQRHKLRRSVNKMRKFVRTHGTFESQAFETVNKLWSAAGKVDDAVTMVDDFRQTLDGLKDSISFEKKSERNWFSDLMKRLEMLALLFVGVSSASSVSNLLSVIGLYVESWYDGPLTPQLVNGIAEALLPESVSETEDLHTQSTGTPDSIELGLQQLRGLFTNWRELLNCELAHKVQNVVNVLITAGFFPEILENNAGETIEQLKKKHGDKFKMPKTMNFAPKGIHLFSVKVWDIQKESISFFDMIIDTTLFFLERGYAAFKYRDLSLLLYSDKVMCAMDKEYTILFNASRQLSTGDLNNSEEFKDISEYEYRLDTLINNMENSIKMMSSDYMRNTLVSRLVVLRKCRSDLLAHLKLSPVKEKPLGVMIHGPSGIGKSTIVQLITKIILHANNIPCKKEHIVTINPSDKFQSELKSSHTAVNIDDVGNKKVEWYTESLSELIIQILNNAPWAALSAIAEEKGNKWPKPKLVTVTTNLIDMMMHLFSNRPESVLRRFELIFDVRLKPDFIDPISGILDKTKVGTAFIPDCWIIDVKYVKLIKTKGNGPDGYEFRDFPGGTGVSLEQALSIAVKYSKTFYTQQKEYVDRVENFYDMDLCEHSRPPHECVCCSSKIQEEEIFQPTIRDRMKLEPQYEERNPTNPFDEDSDSCMKPDYLTPTIVAIPDDTTGEVFSTSLEPNLLFERTISNSVWMPPAPKGYSYVLKDEDADLVSKEELDQLFKKKFVRKEGEFLYYTELADLESQASFTLQSSLNTLVQRKQELFATIYPPEMAVINQLACSDDEPEMHVLEEDFLNETRPVHIPFNERFETWLRQKRHNIPKKFVRAKMTLQQTWNSLPKDDRYSSMIIGALGVPIIALSALKLYRKMSRMINESRGEVQLVGKTDSSQKPRPKCIAEQQAEQREIQTTKQRHAAKEYMSSLFPIHPDSTTREQENRWMYDLCSELQQLIFPTKEWQPSTDWEDYRWRCAKSIFNALSPVKYNASHEHWKFIFELESFLQERAKSAVKNESGTYRKNDISPRVLATMSEFIFVSEYELFTCPLGYQYITDVVTHRVLSKHCPDTYKDKAYLDGRFELMHYISYYLWERPWDFEPSWYDALVEEVTAFIHEFESQGNVISQPSFMPGERYTPRKVVVPDLPLSLQSKTTTSEDLINLCEKKVAHATIVNLMNKNTITCNCFPLGDNLWFFPQHVFNKSASHRITVRYGGRDTLGQVFTQSVSEADISHAPNDRTVVSLRAGGSLRDMSVFLPPKDYKVDENLDCIMVVAETGGIKKRINCRTKKMGDFPVNNGAITVKGISYVGNSDFQKGYCAGPLVPMTTQGFIAAFHLCGSSGTKNFGAGGIFTKADYEWHRSQIKNKQLIAHSEGPFNPKRYGVDPKYTDRIHPGSPVDALKSKDDEFNLALIGSHERPRSSFRSSVRRTPISRAVEEIMNIPKEYRKMPSEGSELNYSNEMIKISTAKNDFDPRILDLATKDLKDKFLTYFDDRPHLLKHVHPYDKMTVINGVDGMRFTDGLVKKTSMGFPINKPKRNYLEPVLEEVEGVTDPYDFIDPAIWEKVMEMEEILASGKRINTVFRANLKDEPRPKTKTTLRFFAGCEVAFVCLVTRWFGGIARMIQNDPLPFECAVGINAHSTQWGDLIEHVSGYGKDRMIAGDYKSFDKTISTDMMMRSFSVLIAIAAKAGYTERQLTILQGIATEISNPLYELHGVFVKFSGSNPSGHPLTVVINNVNNSIYLRYAYYAIYSGRVSRPFDQSVRLVNYGDDNLMSVKEDEPLFTHTNVSNILGDCGVTYTMADKEAESVPYITLNDANFLKRSFVRDDENGVWLAPLELSSMGKMLHTYVYNKHNPMTEKQLMGQVLYTANMEFFHFGREQFEFRQSQLKAVAEKCDLNSHMMALPTYDELMKSFLSRDGMNREPTDEELLSTLVA